MEIIMDTISKLAPNKQAGLAWRLIDHAYAARALDDKQYNALNNMICEWLYKTNKRAAS
jgi:hypothetical protein